MPIDPNIVAGLRSAPINLPDPMEQYSKSLALKSLMAQSDSQDQSRQRQSALQALLATNPDEAALRKAGFLDEALKVGKAGRESAQLDAQTSETRAKTRKAELDAHLQMAQHVSSVYSTAKDQASWDAARRQLHLIDPDAAAQTPAVFDPAFVQNKIAFGQTITQKLADEAARTQQAETGRHNLAGEANAAGTLANARERLAMEKDQPKGTYDPDRGVIVDTRTNQARPVTMADGSPLGAKDKPLTESQGKATGMALRAQKAHELLVGFEDTGTKTPGVIKQGAEGVPVIGGALGMGVNALPSALGGPSSSQRRVEQAQRDFVNAVLRVESGASISESEFNNAKKQYFPQPGEDDATTEQKRRNRETAIESLKLQAGSGAKNIVAKNKPTKPMGGSDMASLSDADLLKALGVGH